MRANVRLGDPDNYPDNITEDKDIHNAVTASVGLRCNYGKGYISKQNRGFKIPDDLNPWFK